MTSLPTLLPWRRFDFAAAPRLAISILALTLSVSLAQSPSQSWTLVNTDERFAGSHGAVSLSTVRGKGSAELQLGCAVKDPSLPTLVLDADRELEAGARGMHANIIGLSTTNRSVWQAHATELELSGFDAALLLSDVVGSSSSRPFFLRLEGNEGLSWSVPRQGLAEVLEVLPCASAFD